MQHTDVRRYSRLRSSCQGLLNDIVVVGRTACPTIFNPSRLSQLQQLWLFRDCN
jgi:hypothetical protein